jgi:hypothetical protein
MGSKNILLFCDGTGNSSDTLLETNVWRAYQAADLGPASPGKRRQIAFYTNGVGTSAFAPLRILEGISGMGLERKVLEVYRYVCRNYEPPAFRSSVDAPEEGEDHIYGFGFSRGAFAIRIVMALIADQGLVPYRTERELQWRTRRAYRAFAQGGIPLFWLRLLSRFGLTALFSRWWLIDRLGGGRTYDRSQNYRPSIRFVGLWDTVAAYGGPFVAITRAVDTWIYRLNRVNYELPALVQRARHALALDDSRESFHPLLWDEVAEDKLIAAGHYPWLDKRRLEQVWFPGVHADVGGGYPKDSLCYASLNWILREAEDCGLRTLDMYAGAYRMNVNPNGLMHDSRSGYGALYRYQPRRIGIWMDPPLPGTLPLRDPAITDVTGRQRGLLRETLVHDSVLSRIFDGTDGYAPIGLPQRFRVVPPVPIGETIPGESSEHLFDEKQKRALWEDSAIQGKLQQRIDRVWPLVRMRRMAYYLAAGSASAIAATPLWADPLARATSTSRFAGAALLAPVAEFFAKPLVGFLEISPAAMIPWVRPWSEHPLWLVGLVAVLSAAIVGAGKLDIRIKDMARSAWLGVFTTSDTGRPGPREALTPAEAESGFFTRVHRSAGVQRALQLIRWKVVPALLILPIVLATFYLVFLMMGGTALTETIAKRG